MIRNHSTRDDPESFFLELFRQNIRVSSDKEEFVFLNIGEKGILIDGYSSLYLNSILVAPNALHFFDREPVVEKKFREFEIMGRGAPYDQYSFVDSEKCRFIQISDVFVKILGECFHYADMIELDEDGNAILPNYNPEAIESFYLLNKIISRSESHCVSMLRSMCPDELRKNRYTFLEMFNLLYEWNM